MAMGASIGRGKIRNRKHVYMIHQDTESKRHFYVIGRYDMPERIPRKSVTFLRKQRRKPYIANGVQLRLF